jgi:hypothetical protein
MGRKQAQTPVFQGFLQLPGPCGRRRGTFMPPGTRFTRCHCQTLETGETMHLDIIMIQPLLALLFGILILILPRLLNYLIAVYLIFIGLVGLFPHMFNTTV